MSGSDEEPEQLDMEEEEVDVDVLDDEMARLLDEYYSTLQVSVFF